MKRRFDRIPSSRDPRDLQLRDYLQVSRLTERFWQVGPPMDQGETGHCIGFGFGNWSNCLPVFGNCTVSDCNRIYYEAVALDGRPGDERGCGLRPGVKAMVKRGRIARYGFGDVDDARNFILSSGPCVFGVMWTDAMMFPDRTGTIHVGGHPLGGHCLIGYGWKDGYFYLQNSWGKWGIKGCCRIKDEDLKALMKFSGEMVAAIELPVVTNPQRR